MFGLLAAGIAGVAGLGGGIFGHLKSRHFVGQRLRYTSVVETPALGLWAGAGATVLSGVAVSFLPILGAGTAIAIGIGVGTGVAMGVREAKEPPKLLDD